MLQRTRLGLVLNELSNGSRSLRMDVIRLLCTFLASILIISVRTDADTIYTSVVYIKERKRKKRKKVIADNIAIGVDNINNRETLGDNAHVNCGEQSRPYVI